MNKIQLLVETGKKKVFVSALDWPGWSRSGSEENSALLALLEYAPRYASVLSRVGVPFVTAFAAEDLLVVERLAGGAATDIGAPSAIPSTDCLPVSADELEHLLAVLDACWQAFAAALKSAEGKELRKGPRGGGRQHEAMLRHVIDAQNGYLSAVGAKSEKSTDLNALALAAARALRASARGEFSSVGPRGGARWPARYFARRSAWHILDHAWEIEDRIEG